MVIKKNKNRKALIIGVTGQDGSYLAEFLLKKKYEVHGIKRKVSNFNSENIDHILNKNNKFTVHYGDINDFGNLFSIIKNIKPDEIYNLAAQSHVKVSFELPIYTAETNAIGSLKILEIIRQLDPMIKYYQAGTSEMFGNTPSKKQNEKTVFDARSVYSASKIFAHQVTKNYREAYNLFASNGILFNHESPRRNETFVTKKIIKGLIDIKLGRKKILLLGNLYSKRDWGHAKDYVRAMWLILQQKKPDDFVISTGKQYTVKKFAEIVSRKLGFKIYWRNKGIKEVGIDKLSKKTIIKIDKKYFRPTEVDSLIGDYSKSKKILKWKQEYNLESLIDDMIENEKKF